MERKKGSRGRWQEMELRRGSSKESGGSVFAETENFCPKKGKEKEYFKIF